MHTFPSHFKLINVLVFQMILVLLVHALMEAHVKLTNQVTPQVIYFTVHVL